MNRAHELKIVEAENVLNSIDNETAVVLFTHIEYRTGRMHNMKAISEKALVVWDLAHLTKCRYK